MNEAKPLLCLWGKREKVAGGLHQWIPRFNFNVSQTSKKIERWRLGSSISEPPNCDCWTIDIRDGLHSKLLTSTVGLAMLEDILWTPGVMKSQSVLLWLSPPPAIFTDSSLVLRLLWSLCFFLLRWKVRSISGSGSYANGLRIKGKIALQTHSQHYQSNKKWKRIKSRQKHLVTFTRITQYLEKLIPGNGAKNLIGRKRTMALQLFKVDPTETEVKLLDYNMSKFAKRIQDCIRN